MPYVYRHIRLDKNEPFYIGIGSDEACKRAYSKHNRNQHWRRIVNKCDYKVEIVMDNVDWKDACEKERELVALYKRKFEGGTLVNITAGGEGNLNPDEETRLKISNSQKGTKNNMHGKSKNEAWYKSMEALKGEGNPNYGKPIPEWHKEILRNAHLGTKLSDAVKEKISKANKGKKRTDAARRKMSASKGKSVIDTTTQIIYNNVTAAAQALGYNRRTLTSWLNGTLKNKSTLTFYTNENS